MNVIRMRTPGLVAATLLALSLAASAPAASVPAQAYFVPPVPDQPGEWYVYYDAYGARVGRASMDCDGNLGGSGIATEDYITGMITCP